MKKALKTKTAGIEAGLEIPPLRGDLCGFSLWELRARRASTCEDLMDTLFSTEPHPHLVADATRLFLTWLKNPESTLNDASTWFTDDAEAALMAAASIFVDALAVTLANDKPGWLAAATAYPPFSLLGEDAWLHALEEAGGQMVFTRAELVELMAHTDPDIRALGLSLMETAIA